MCSTEWLRASRLRAKSLLAGHQREPCCFHGAEGRWHPLLVGMSPLEHTQQASLLGRSFFCLPFQRDKGPSHLRCWSKGVNLCIRKADSKPVCCRRYSAANTWIWPECTVATNGRVECASLTKNLSFGMMSPQVCLARAWIEERCVQDFRVVGCPTPLRVPLWTVQRRRLSAFGRWMRVLL